MAIPFGPASHTSFAIQNVAPPQRREKNNEKDRNENYNIPPPLLPQDKVMDEQYIIRGFLKQKMQF